MKNLDKESVIGISALLVHAAHIDEIYSAHEKELILNFIKSYLKNIDANEILKKAEDIEKNSNQILDFTRKIKDVDKDKKLLIVKSLWEIIYSDDKSDMFEANLMRRLTGLLYLDPKEVGDLKEEVKNK